MAGEMWYSYMISSQDYYISLTSRLSIYTYGILWYIIIKYNDGKLTILNGSELSCIKGNYKGISIAHIFYIMLYI